jgi:hypothetical protein
MYKILVVIRSISNIEGGRTVSQQLIEFDNKGDAQYAYDQLMFAKTSEWSVVKLWK